MSATDAGGTAGETAVGDGGGAGVKTMRMREELRVAIAEELERDGDCLIYTSDAAYQLPP